jgi:hypothetical protein
MKRIQLTNKYNIKHITTEIQIIQMTYKLYHK